MADDGGEEFDTLRCDVTWYGKSAAAYDTLVESEVLNTWYRAAFAFRPGRALRPIDLAAQERNIAEIARYRTVRRLTEPGQPAILVVRVASKRQFRDLDCDMHNMQFRLVASAGCLAPNVLDFVTKRMQRKIIARAHRTVEQRAGAQFWLLTQSTVRHVAPTSAEFDSMVLAMKTDGFKATEPIRSSETEVRLSMQITFVRANNK